MKKFFTLAISLMALSASQVAAQDFTVLTTPEDVLNNSIEKVSGAKAAFAAVLGDAASTDKQKTAAMQEYEQKADPKPGYAFDMSFLMSYTAVTADNKGQYSQAKLAEAWHCDISGITFGENNTLMVASSEKAGTYMRVDVSKLSSNPFVEEASYGKFALYQNVTLSDGSYQLNSDGYVAGLAKGALLAAGETDCAESLIGGGVMKPYKVNFKMAKEGEIKLGFKRSSTAGKLTQIAFNNVCLYKVSDIIEIKNDATEGLTAAEDVNVQICRDFAAGKYVPVCFPFVIENWRDIFEDVIYWNNYTDDRLNFVTLAGANTQARKPYLVKTKENIDADNYLLFKGVDVQKGNAGSWIKSVAEGEEAFPVKMQGNWAAGTVPAGCYYLNGTQWILSDGTAPLQAFSCYIDATGLTSQPATLEMTVNNTDISTIVDVISGEANSLVDVYSIQGTVIRRNVKAENALTDLPAGLYIVNGKKIFLN